MGIIYHCPSYPSRNRTCVNEQGVTYKDYDFIIEDTHTQQFLDGREHPNHGGWKVEVALGFKGYCKNCIEGRTEPRNQTEREEFLDGYLGEHKRWDKEKEKRRKLVVEQERLLEKLRKEKGENEAWMTEAD